MSRNEIRTELQRVYLALTPRLRGDERLRLESEARRLTSLLTSQEDK